MLKLCLVLCKVASKTKILVLVSEFVVVAILSEWWLVPTSVGTSLEYFLTNLVSLLLNPNLPISLGDKPIIMPMFSPAA